MTENASLIARKPNVYRLSVGDVFNRLTPKEKLYAHHMAQAAWSGTRIILRQVSPESESIYDFIVELWASCQGDWGRLVAQTGISSSEMEDFLNYAALFLANIGNYYASCTSPLLSDRATLEKLTSKTDDRLYSQFQDSIIATSPSGLGYSGPQSQSAYYLGEPLSRKQISVVNRILEEKGIYPENTRIHCDGHKTPKVLSVLQASTKPGEITRVKEIDGFVVRLESGDHFAELQKICQHLEEAKRHAANNTQEEVISLYQQTFITGQVDFYKMAQERWVKDIKPSVECILGFVEPYRDPCGVRAEFEGLVAIVDDEETKALSKLVGRSSEFIKILPWVDDQIVQGKGPFEREMFDPPDYTSLHVLAYCSSIIFLGINLPNYNDIRQTVGFKNIMVANRNQPLSTSDIPPFVSSSDAPNYIKHAHIAWKLQITLHELFGHGTGKLLMQTTPNDYNFDISNPPINPLTNEMIKTWYRLGETWNSVFGDIAASVDECRAELVGSFLMAEKDILSIFGFTDKTEITADDLIYNIYLQLGVLGLRALESYSIEEQKWGQAHDRGHFAMFRTLLHASDFMKVHSTPSMGTIKVSIEKSKIHTHGRRALSALLLKLHIWRCTADVNTCRAFYEDLTRPDEEALEWRKIVLANQRPRQIFVQANTFVDDGGELRAKEYEMSVRGLIQSWGEREMLLRGGTII